MMQEATGQVDEKQDYLLLSVLQLLFQRVKDKLKVIHYDFDWGKA